MSWRKTFVVVGCSILVVVVAAGLWLSTANLGIFKPQLERWVTRVTGRQLAIRGDFDVHLGDQTVIIARDVRFANAPWAVEPSMLEVGHFEMRVSTRSFFNGPVQIDLIKLTDARLHLQRSATTGPNWAVLPPEADGDEPPAPKEATGELLIEQIDIERALLVYDSDERLGPIEMQIDRLSQLRNERDFLELDFRARVADRNISLDGTVGSWQALRAQKNVAYDLNAQVDTLRVVSEGFIDDLRAPRRPSVRFVASSPDVNDLARLLRIDPQYAGGIDISGELVAQDNQPLALSVEGTVGLMQAHATGSFSDLQSLDKVDLDLAASGPDLSRVMRLFGVHRFQSAPFELDLSAQRIGPELIIRKGHMTFAQAQFDLAGRLPNFPTVDEGSGHLEINGDDFQRFCEITGLPGAAKGAFGAVLDLKQADNGVEIVALDVESALLRAQAHGKLGEAPDYLGTQLQFELDIDSLASIGDAYRLAPLPERPVHVAGNAVLVKDAFKTRGPVAVVSGDISARLDGLIALSPGVAGSDLAVTLEGPDLGQLVGLFAPVATVVSLPYVARGQLGIERSRYRLQGLSATVGSNRIGLDGVIEHRPNLAGSKLSLSASGPALEEWTEPLRGLKIQPGSFEFSSNVAFTKDAVALSKLSLERGRGRASGNIELALPVATKQAKFNVSARGLDVRNVIASTQKFEIGQAPFSVDLDGDLAGSHLSLTRFDVGVGDAQATISGDIDFAAELESTQLSVALDVPDLAALGRFNGRALRGQRLLFDARLASGDGAFDVDRLVASLGDSDILGSIHLQTGTTPRLDVALQSDSVWISPLLEPVNQAVSPPPPPIDDGRLIPDVDFSFEWMRRLDATLSVEIGKLQPESLYARNVSLAANLHDGALVVSKFDWEGVTGRIQAAGSLEPGNGEGNFTLQLAARDYAVPSLLQHADGSANANLDLDLDLRAKGADLRSMAASLNGVAMVDLEGLRVGQNRYLTRLYGDVLGEIVNVVNPFAKDQSTVMLECFVAPLEITDGMLVTAPGLLLRTGKITIMSESSVNLHNEELSIEVRTTPRKGITISAGEVFNPYVRVAGTLAQPRLVMDERGVLVSGGAAVATGGLSIMAKALWSRVFKDSDPCKTARERGNEAIGERFPVFEPSP